MPRVSVFMPSYNHAPWVVQAVESVISQTYQDLEIVVTDDGSSDDTADVIAGIAEPRLSLKRFPRNRGACAAVNDAIARCRGEYLTLLNSDDVFLPEKLQLQVAYLDAHPETGAVFGYPAFVDENMQPLPQGQTFMGGVFEVENRTQEGWLNQFFFHGNCFCHPTMMIRRECYEKVGKYDERLAQLPDLDMWIRLVSAFPVHIMPQPLTRFRILRNSANASAPRPDKLVRLMWEDVQVRKHYLTLPQQQFEGTFARELAQQGIEPREARALVLGRLCMAASSPTLHRLGLELLFDALPPQSVSTGEADAFSHADYLRQTADKDVFNTLLPFRIKELESQKQVQEDQPRQASGPVPLALSMARAGRPFQWSVTPPVDRLRLHLGCGPNVIPSWVNIDAEAGPGVFQWDLNRALPFEDASASFVYSEHMIEHVELPRAMALLHECLRVLCPGGILRLSTPDLDFLIDAYRARRLNEWQDMGFLPGTPCDLVNESMRAWGNQYLFDSEQLAACLTAAGFATTVYVPWRKSCMAELCNLESRPFHRELILEAQKQPA